MDARAYADSLTRDAGALADAAEGNLDRRVPSCPDWSVADLVHHVGVDVVDFWRQVAERRLQDPNGATEPGWPPDDRLIPLLRENAKRLADVLEGADPTVPVWSWSPRKDIGFIQRQMAQETAVHRWDGQAVVGAPAAIDRELAADGRLAFDREPGPADVTAAAPLSDLLLLLWRRVTPVDVDVEGDRGALERFLARADLD